MLDSDDLKAWPAFAAIALWIVWRIYVNVSSNARARKRGDRIGTLASALGLQLDPDPKSAAHEKLHRAYNEAVTANSSRDKPGFGFGISSLYRGSGLTIFEIGKSTRKGSHDGIALGIHTDGLGVPPFRRRKPYALQIVLEEARRAGNVLDLSDGTFVLVRDPQDKTPLSRIFSAPVMTFLASHPLFELAGNGDDLWLSDALYEDEENVGTVFAEAAQLFRSEIRRREDPTPLMVR